jgi:hypothetical protein
MRAQVYSDTKIRLHFSHFKILDSARETCFLDKPHQCPDMRASSKWDVGATGEASGSSSS